MAPRLVSYVPQTQPTMDGGDQLYLQQQLAAISGAIGASNAVVTTNTTNIATNTASIAAHEAAWTAYTPTVTAYTGAFTTVSATGRYKTIGKTVFVSITVSVPNAGTASYPIVTLPFTAAVASVLLPGVERALTAKALDGRTLSGPTDIIIAYYDNAVTAVNGTVLTVGGVYERV